MKFDKIEKMKKILIFLALFAGFFAKTFADDTEEKPSKIQKAKELYSEYREKSDEVHDSQKISGVQLVADFITDKLPLTLDLGAEPGENGSTIFGILQYDWTEHFSSRIKLEYDSRSTSRKTDSTLIFSSKQIGVTILPYMRYFGDDDNNAKTPLFWVGGGAFYAFNWGKIDIFQSQTQYFLFGTIDFRYHIFGPVAQGGIKLPLGRAFVLCAEASYRPISRIVQAISLDGYTTGFEENSKEIADTPFSQASQTSTWSQPYIYQAVMLDIFSYFRIKTSLEYNRLVLQQREQNSDGTLSGDDETQETLSWRIGTEIVLPSSNKTRKKNSHLWAGVYYESEWQKNTKNDSSNTTRTGKILFCFGK